MAYVALASSRSASSIQCAVLLFLSSTYCSRIDIRCLFATTERSKFSSFRKFRTLASCRRQIRMDWHEINIRQPFQYRLSDVPNNNRSGERKKNSFPYNSDVVVHNKTAFDLRCLAVDKQFQLLFFRPQLALFNRFECT